MNVVNPIYLPSFLLSAFQNYWFDYLQMQWGGGVIYTNHNKELCFVGGGPVRIAFAGIERECMFNAALRHSTYAMKQ
jgi:hypothetical protein